MAKNLRKNKADPKTGSFERKSVMEREKVPRQVSSGRLWPAHGNATIAQSLTPTSI